MKSESMFRLTAVIAALHVVVLSMVFGLRHMGYMLTATLSATILWSIVWLLGGRRRIAGITVGAMIALIVHQVVYHGWKAELPGFWWPLAQFGALQFLVAYGIGRTAP